MTAPRNTFVTLLFSGSVVVAAGAACAGEDRRVPVSLDVRVAAREVAPGEPLRVHVNSNVALASLDATLLDEPVYLTAFDDSGMRWTGWSMVGLDQGPGLVEVVLIGRTRDGRAARRSQALKIGSKEFPQENLTVSSMYVEPPKEVLERIAREKEKLARIYAHREHFVPPTEPFVRPVPGVNTSVFGMRRLFNGQPRSPHPGLDLRATEGTPVHAAGPGRVVLAEELYYSGNLVILDHGGGLFTLYAHLAEIHVREGQQAAAGDLLGDSGATGRVTGPHLHWGAKIGDRPFDPEALLAEALF